MEALTVHITIAGITHTGFKDERKQYFVESEAGIPVAVDEYTDYLKWLADGHGNLLAKFMLLALCKADIKSRIDDALTEKEYARMAQKCKASEKEAIKTSLEGYIKNLES